MKAWVPKELAGSDGEGQMNPDLWSYLYQWWFRTHYPKVEDRIALLSKEWAGEGESA